MAWLMNQSAPSEMLIKVKRAAAFNVNGSEIMSMYEQL